MLVLIPLGGIGVRFKQHGYSQPKAFVRVKGKPILYYLLDCISQSSIHIDTIFIPYNKEYSHYNIEDKLKRDYPQLNFQFLKLIKDTDGAAETINCALKTVQLDDKPILCLDADNFYSVDVVSLWKGENKVFVFEDNCSENGTLYSFVASEDRKHIKDIVEKEKISNLACTGAYGFSSWQDLCFYTDVIVKNKMKQKGEFYTSTVIKEMLKNKISFTAEIISVHSFHCLGTPYHIQLYHSKHPKCPPMRFCFDIDNTLVTHPTVPNDYSTVQAIPRVINYLRHLKSLGHTIILYTARRMRTHQGNIGKINADVAKITFETLDKFSIPYDEIYFGKPYADFYIDDLAVNCFTNIEKECGFYLDTIQPRDHNSVFSSTMNTIIKSSLNLNGEIFFYRNIPNELQKMFPILIDYDKHNLTWLKIEKIEGLPLSNMYLSEILTPKILLSVMEELYNLHKFPISATQKQNIYGNYCKKLKNRYESYDYSMFNNSAKCYQAIYSRLQEYEEKNNAKMSIIHGDPVLTNILMTPQNKLKFIDMRGKQDDDLLTIYGDSMYDWAKLYQSLHGYDKILQDKEINNSYEKGILSTFEQKFLEWFSQEDFDDLRWITKSLLFSLIPLHNNNKCIEYYNLISKI